MKTRPGLWHIHVAALLFGGAGLFGKLLDLSPATITLGRAFFASLALLIATRVLRVDLAVRSRRAALSLLLGGLLLAAHWVTFFRAIQVSSVAIGLLSFSSFPIFVVFLEPLCFGEKLRAADVAMAAAVTLGLAVMPSGGASDHAVQGVLWGVASGFTFAFLALINRSQVGAQPPLAVAFYENAVAAACLIPLAHISRPLAASTLLTLVLLGVVFTALAHVLFIESLRHIKAQLASVIISLEPIYGIAFAWLLLHEVPAPRTLLGGALILLTVFVAMRRSSVASPASA
jgi:drug/metabolite transporter (DMT)-like permease